MLNGKSVKVLILSVFICTFFAKPALSQQTYLVRGAVFHANTGEPVAGANVVVWGSSTGTSSNDQGFFELKLPKGNYRISVTSVGFSRQEILAGVPLESGGILNVKLSPMRHEIEGVDVFGRSHIPDLDTSINRIPLSILPSMSFISAAEIEKQGSVTLVDAMKFVPGGWTETRGRKTKQFFSVRGQKYPYPDYSIDGVWQREFEETGYFLSSSDIESVEIIRSANALVRGLSGLTGVIDVKTKRPERETVSLLAKYGELNHYFANLQYGNRIEDLSFKTSATFFGTDGPSGKNGKERLGNFHGTLDWQASDKIRLAAGATFINGLRQLIKIDDETGAPNIKNRVEKYDPLRTLLTWVKLNYRGKGGSITELQTNFAYRDVDFISFNITQESTAATEENDWEYGVNALHSRHLGNTNTLRLGGLYNHWVAPEGKRYYVGRSCNVHTFSGVITDEQKAGDFLFDAGIRMIGGHIVEWGGFGIEGSAAGFDKVAAIEDQALPIEWQSVLGASWLLSGSSSIHYNFSGGTIAPRKGSLTDDGSAPETEGRFNHELGFRFQLPGKLEFSASSFFTQRRNAVDYSGSTIVTENDLVMELYENLDKRSYGVEGSAKIMIPGIHSSLFANGMLMKGEKELNDSMTDDDQLPKVLVNAGWLFDNAGFDASLFMNYTGPYSNNRFVHPNWIKANGDFPLGDFTSVDLTAGYTFNNKYPTRIFVEVKNALDKKYMTVAGYPDAGRILMAGLKITYSPD